MDAITKNFLSLCAIPHKSHHEEAISRFLYDWAAERGFAVCRDDTNNIIIEKPAFPGREQAPTVILQAHMDMVTVAAEGVAFDPLTDPIRPVFDGDWLRAEGTSLGGDDGAGVALAMAILEDPDAVHGPLRAVFTTDEEAGMSGAMGLDARHLQGEYLINLDWEIFGSLCCSSAGSEHLLFRRPARRSAPGQKARFYSVTLRGLEGGHSGAEIHLGRMNAIRALADILLAGHEAAGSLTLASFRGGSASNAIPSSASAVVAVPGNKTDDFRKAARERADALLAQFRRTDPNATVEITEAAPAEKVLPEFITRDALGLLTSARNGVYTLSESIPGLVESSSNIGIAELTEEEFTVEILPRSSAPELMEEMHAEYKAQAHIFGFAMEASNSAPAWPVRPDSPLVALTCRKYRELFGEDITVEPVHAGLECGVFSEKNPGLDIISIGPDIVDIHSPREKLNLPSVAKCDALVRGLLEELAKL